MGRRKKVEEQIVEDIQLEEVVEQVEDVIKKPGWVESLPSNVTTNTEVDLNDPRTRSDR